MPVYVILFRGVGGATQLPTAKLRAALSEAGFENVATYINSGNAVVKSRLGGGRVVETIAKICKAEFGFGKEIYAPTLDDWERLIDRNPFPDSVTPGRQLHAAVLAKTPDPARVAALEELAATTGERFALVGEIAYIHTPEGFGKSKLGERFDRGIGVPNTARNWNTVLKLRELAQKAAE